MVIIYLHTFQSLYKLRCEFFLGYFLGFQKRVLYLLAELKADVAELKQGRGSTGGVGEISFTATGQSTTMDEFHMLDNDCRVPQEYQKMVDIFLACIIRKFKPVLPSLNVHIYLTQLFLIR